MRISFLLFKTLAFAVAALFILSCSNTNENVCGIIPVDLGLSVEWSSCNLGTTEPLAIGDQYSWGEIQTYGDHPYKFFHVSYSESNVSGIEKVANTVTASARSLKRAKEPLKNLGGIVKEEYGSQNDKKYKEETIIIKYRCEQKGKDYVRDNIEYLQSEDDAACQILGAEWSIPTQEQWTELFDNCDYIVDETRSAIILTSKITGNTILLPYSDDVAYWTNQLSSKDENAYAVNFHNEGYHFVSKSRPENACIRAVHNPINN